MGTKAPQPPPKPAPGNEPMSSPAPPPRKPMPSPPPFPPSEMLIGDCDGPFVMNWSKKYSYVIGPGFTMTQVRRGQ